MSQTGGSAKNISWFVWHIWTQWCQQTVMILLSTPVSIRMHTKPAYQACISLLKYHASRLHLNNPSNYFPALRGIGWVQWVWTFGKCALCAPQGRFQEQQSTSISSHLSWYLANVANFSLDFAFFHIAVRVFFTLLCLLFPLWRGEELRRKRERGRARDGRRLCVCWFKVWNFSWPNCRSLFHSSRDCDCYTRFSASNRTRILILIVLGSGGTSNVFLLPQSNFESAFASFLFWGRGLN